MKKTPEQSVIQIATMLLMDVREEEDRDVTFEDILEAIRKALSLKPAWADGLDTAQVEGELTRRFGQWIAG